MKRVVWVLWLVCLAVLSPRLLAQETAKISLHCWSIRTEPVTTNINNVYYHLEFGVLERYDQPANGELRPGFEDSVGNFVNFRGFYRLTDTRLTVVASDDMTINLPPAVDQNQNQINDFFEVSQAVDAQAKPSIFEAPVTGGTVEPHWTRPANSSAGVLTLHMVSASLANLDATFLVPFHIYEYDGTLTYTPGNPTVTGNVDAALTSNPSTRLTGPISFTKFDPTLLAAVPGTWTNAAGQSIPYKGYISDTNQPALIGLSGVFYEGLMSFDDGSLGRGNATVYDIYGNPQPVVWDMLIEDDNDYDSNGLPDFSDSTLPPVRVLPQPPRLALTSSSGQRALWIMGQTGNTYQIQRSASLGPPAWQAVTSLTLTNATQAFPWSFPTNASSFWRAVIQ